MSGGCPVPPFACALPEWKLADLYEKPDAPKLESDPAVFGSMRSREKAAVLAILHIFTVCLQHAGIGPGLRKHFAQHREIEELP